VRVGARAVAAGTASALVSAGPTGATVAAALLEIGRIPGVRRPVVGARIPVAGGGHAVLVDAGGVPDPTPDLMVTSARLGMAYAQALQDQPGRIPRVGLLNVGAEPGKGNALARSAYDLLGALDRFVGNVEPAAVLAGDVDVVVTDGFTGNVFLKTLEAMAASRRPGSGPGDSDAAALLLGVRGTVLIAHGAADADEIAAALRLADHLVRADLVGRLVGSPPADDLGNAE